jgi:hypothetical protein
MSGEMGLYFRAEFWFARTGVGLYGGRLEGWGATLRSRGMGEQMAVPNGAKFSGFRGSGMSVDDGLEVRMGAMVGVGRFYRL